MHKKDFHRNCCGAACCLALILALSGCSASNANGAQGNQASGAPSTERAADNQQAAGTQQNETEQEIGTQPNTVGQETGTQQNAVGQETGTQQNAAGQDLGTQQNAVGQETGTQQNAAGQDLGTQQNAVGQEIGTQQNATGQDLGAQQNAVGQETGTQQNAAGQDLGTQQNAAGQEIGSQDFGYHQHDEPAAGQHSSGNEIDLEAAKRIALQNAGVESADAAFTKAQLDYDDGVAEYEIEFVAGSTKYEYEISAANGTVLKSSKESVEQISGGTSSQASISVDEAKSIALNYAKFTADQVVYTKSELDYDDGRAEYEIEFYAGGKEYSFTIDAVSGTVLEMEID